MSVYEEAYPNSTLCFSYIVMRLVADIIIMFVIVFVVQCFSYLMEKLQLVNMKPDFLNRNVNEGFSGGERKRNEILQLAVLGADLAILDEIDSGLDVDALRDVAGAVNRILTPQNSLMMITHYRRILDLLNPTHVHVMVTYDLLFIFIVVASFAVVIRVMLGFSLFVIGVMMLVLSNYFSFLLGHCHI